MATPALAYGTLIYHAAQRCSQLQMEGSMGHILGLVLILASNLAMDGVNDDDRHLTNPDCGYVCVFPEERTAETERAMDERLLGVHQAMSNRSSARRSMGHSGEYGRGDIG